MQRCLELAERGINGAAPNPMVGAVLVHNNRIIGEGWHQICGSAHAEVNCLNSVTEANRHLIAQSTMYVSLEPCAHFGKTPPCANRLVAESIRNVVICNRDPFEKVSGKGIDILLKAGTRVQSGILEQQGRWLNRRFFHFHEEGRPFIILKWAQSADGYFAPANRSRKQLSGPESQMLVHKWRTEEQAIMVATTTAVNDNPVLTARKWEGRQPLRVVLDAALSVPETHELYNGQAKTLVINEKKSAIYSNVELERIPDTKNLKSVLDTLKNRNIISVLVEGGATLLNNFLQSGLWDEARIFTSPIVLGNGIEAPSVKNATLREMFKAGDDNLTIFTRKNGLD